MIPAVQEAATPTPAPKMEKLQELARSFESIFLHLLMKSMRSSVPTSGFLGGGPAESMSTDLLDLQVAERGSGKGKGLGIADMILQRYSQHVDSEPQSEAKG